MTALQSTRSSATLPTSCRAARLVAARRVEIVDTPVPAPGPGQVLVRLEGCGVCGSNIPPYEGRPWFDYPMPAGNPGHEGWGVVEAVGEGVESPGDGAGGGGGGGGAGETLRVGDRVAALSYNAFAEYDVADASACVKVPDALAGRPFPGEPLGCAMNVFRRSGIGPGDRVAVVGLGFLGALVTQLAAAEGARVVGLSRRPDALDACRRCGADAAIPLGAGDPHQAAIDANGGRSYDVVVEATGKQDPLSLASGLVRERGRLVIAGFHQDGPRTVDMQSWNWRGIDVINAHERDPREYALGMRLAAQAIVDGRMDPFHLYTHAFPLERAGGALAATAERPHGFMKALILND